MFRCSDIDKTVQSQGQALRVVYSHIRFLWKDCSYKLQRVLIRLEIGSSSSLFRIKSVGRAANPMPLFPPNISDKNFEVAVFLTNSAKINHQKLRNRHNPLGPGPGVVISENMFLMEGMLV